MGINWGLIGNVPQITPVNYGAGILQGVQQGQQMQANQQSLDFNKQMNPLKIQEAQNTVDQGSLETKLHYAKAVSDIAASVHFAPEDQKPAAYDQAVQKAQQLGLDTSQMPKQWGDDARAYTESALTQSVGASNMMLEQLKMQQLQTMYGFKQQDLAIKGGNLAARAESGALKQNNAGIPGNNFQGAANVAQGVLNNIGYGNVSAPPPNAPTQQPNTMVGGSQQPAQASTNPQQNNSAQQPQFIPLTLPERTDRQKQIIGNIQTQALVDKVTKEFDPKYLTYQGKAMGVIDKAFDMMNASDDDQQKYLATLTPFQKDVTQLLLTYRKSMDGSRPALGDLSIIKQAMLNSESSPTQMKSLLGSVKYNMQLANKINMDLLQKGISTDSEYYPKMFDKMYEDARKGSAIEKLDSGYETNDGQPVSTTVLQNAMKNKNLTEDQAVQMYGLKKKSLTNTDDNNNNDGSKMLGDISAKYESNGNAGTISNGAGDPGGKSYGTFQLASKTGTLQSFLQNSGYDKQFAGMGVGSKMFDDKWKELASNDQNFGKAQQEFIAKTHFDPVAQHAQALGIQMTPAIEEALFSMGVQHAGASKIVDAAVKSLGGDASQASQQQIIQALYDSRRKYVGGLSSLSSALKQSLMNRYAKEEHDVLGLT